MDSKDTSGTGYMRFGEAMNLRTQDGLKKYLLCDNCEQRFAQWEKVFAETIFVPLHKDQVGRFSYGPWLEKFAVSVSWRVLSFFKLENDLSHLPSNLIPAVDRALKTWKEFLLDERSNPGSFEQHMLPLGLIDHTDMDIPPNINRYFLRSVDLDVAHAQTKAFVYAKMCCILLVGFIEMPDPKQWEGTKLHVKTGILGSKEYTLPGEFGEYLKYRAHKASMLQKKVSDRQKKRIKETYRQNLDRAARSESFTALHQDVMLFGRTAFEHDAEPES